jgi:hypothetical protein
MNYFSSSASESLLGRWESTCPSAPQVVREAISAGRRSCETTPRRSSPVTSLWR